MNPLATELAHMTAYLSESPTSFRAWRQYFEHKAQEMASADPDEYSQLPMKLAAEIAKIRSKHSQSPQQGKATS